MRARVAKRPTQSLKIRLLAFADQFDLQLRESVDAAFGVEDGHFIDGDVGDRAALLLDTGAEAPRPQRRDRLEPAVPHVGDEKPLERRRRTPGPSRLLELGALGPVAGTRQLQLPERRAALDPSPERDAAWASERTGVST